MRRTLFVFIIASIILGQLLLVSGLQAVSMAGGDTSAGGKAILLPPTARPSLTPSLTPPPAATNTPGPQPPGPGPTDTPLPATPTPLPPTAVIANKAINVRFGPGVIYDIIGVARQDERYLITGQFPPGDWLQIDYNGKVGWIFRALVTLEGQVDQIPPVTDIPPTPTFTPSPTPTETSTPTSTPTLAPTREGETPASTTIPPPTDTPRPPTATPGPPVAIITGQNVPIREGPGLIYDIIAEAKQGEEYPITGLSITGDWFQIDYRGQPGWVFLIQMEPKGDIEGVPIIEEIPPTPTFTPAPETPTPEPAGETTSPQPLPTTTPTEGSGGPPSTLLLIGGLLALIVAAGVIYYFIRNR